MAVSLVHREDTLGFDLLASKELLEELRTTPIIEGEWKELKLELLKANGDRTLIELLRPISWVEENLKEVDSTIYISLPEMGSIGDARVLSIHSSTIKLPDSLGSYRPVTGKFVHISNMVWELTFEGMEEPLGVTSNHPIWSNKRQRWVEAGELRIGEGVKTQFGITRLLNKQYLEGEHKVYNIEVHDAHNYFVSSEKILVHNNGPSCRVQVPAAVMESPRLFKKWMMKFTKKDNPLTDGEARALLEAADEAGLLQNIHGRWTLKAETHGARTTSASSSYSKGFLIFI